LLTPLQIEPFTQAAASARAYALDWKARIGGKVIAAFPMHFPAEVIHAAGALPVVLQEVAEEITVGHGMIYPFYCGFSRSAVDQALKGELDFADAVVLGDTCVQILGAADVVRMEMPDLPVYFFQLLACMRDSWTMENVAETIAKARRGVEHMLDTTITDEALWASIALFNRNRQLIREIYDLRRISPEILTGAELQDIVKSSMIMDKAEHNALLTPLVESLRERLSRDTLRTRIFVSGHMCHAPKPEILALIEEVGGVIADDDLYTGFRHVSTDITGDSSGDPIFAMTEAYVARNAAVPDPTKIDPEVDWDGYLLRAMEASRSQGLIVLMPKYCEPHMYYYPEIKEAFEARGIPHLLIETDHEELPIETLRTRVETFVEMLRQREPA
jgi:bcr-type benzoyl-CoA reductase subunit C